MKTTVKHSLLALGLALLGLALGYGWGTQQHSAPAAAGAAPVVAGTPPAASAPRQPLYYRNPMGLPDTSPTPKKDAMGMDYIPVFAEEAPGAASDGGTTLKLSLEKVQKLGVRTEAVALRDLQRAVRASARIEPDERRVFAVAPKFEGFVDRLIVNATGQAVTKGQPMLEVYSPELVSAQREYAIAIQGQVSLTGAGEQAQASMRQLAQASLARLRNWDISDGQIQKLAQTGDVQRSLSFLAPVSGVVMEKKAVQGMRFMPGEVLFQVADLSNVWVIADVFEQDLAALRVGSAVKVTINAYPDQTWNGHVSHVYPTFKSETRTAQVRIELPNPGLRLKPGMYAQAELPSASVPRTLAVPASAVLDSGTRQVVLVQVATGRFEPRPVRLGMRTPEHVQVLEGVREGEQVVVAANFLIDAESNLQAALNGLTPPPSTTPSTTPPAGASTPASVSHKAVGVVEQVDTKAMSASVTHEPVASLKWPAMTMDFQASNSAVLAQLKAGARVQFEFVERKPGEWVITQVRPAAQATR